jgi:flavin reductase (DIM6/NTAB) family NADH-FMN oxidoreductase RutF
MAEFSATELSKPDLYKFMTRVVVPRPIAWVSSVGADGHYNLAPFSYFSLGGANPPSCVFCPTTGRDGSFKDTLRNIEATREYVINVVTYDLVERMNQTSYTYPHGVSEFSEVGFTAAPALTVKAPRVAESPIHMECRLFTVLKHGDGPLSSNYIVGEITHFHVDDALLTDGFPDNEKFELVGRLGGEWYSRNAPGNLFSVPRPTKP